MLRLLQHADVILSSKTALAAVPRHQQLDQRNGCINDNIKGQ
jgi:hypothetical protein